MSSVYASHILDFAKSIQMMDPLDVECFLDEEASFEVDYIGGSLFNIGGEIIEQSSEAMLERLCEELNTATESYLAYLRSRYA